MGYLHRICCRLAVTLPVPEANRCCRYASMQGDVEAHRQKVRLQLCATTATSQAGQPFWSSPVQLDALGGAAVVEAPCPMTAAPSHKEAQAGFQLAVTAVQVESRTLIWSMHTKTYY